MISTEELQERWNKSWQAHQMEVTKYTLIDQWYTAFEKHLQIGESWGESYRFPELFGCVQRKYDNLIEFWPNCKIKGNGDGVIAAQSAFDHQVRISNLEREKNRVGMDAIKMGWGVLFCAPVRYERKTKDGIKVFYDGLGAERIDPRDLIPAYSALVMHDHTGQAYCPYVFRRRIYFDETFKRKYGPDVKDEDGNTMFNQEIVGKIQPTAYSGGFTGARPPTQREGKEKEQGRYVIVLEYWDEENDDLVVFAQNFNNKIYESKVGIPYAHKQLPFHFYYDYRREDSIFGLGEVELNMPYNLFKETVLNLMIDNAKLELQPGYIIAGDVSFNAEENELQPGGIFTLKGQNVGKVSDSIMPFRPSGISQDIPMVLDKVEDSRTIVTGDDSRALYENPNQLATQTLSKKEALQKRIKGNVLRNAIESEWYLANQILSYLKNELAHPYKDEEGNTTFRSIKINGYEAIQSKKESAVEFKQVYGADSDFQLNSNVAEDMDECEIEVITDKLNAEIKRDETEKIMMFMQTVMQTAQINPAFVKDMDITEFLKQVAEKLSLDIHKIYPPAASKAEEIDVINTEHNQIAMGIVPDIKKGEDSEDHYEKHVEFQNSSVFKGLGKKAKDAMRKHKLLTLQNVQQKVAAPTSEPAGMGGTDETGNQPAVQGMGQPMGQPAQGGGTGLPPQGFAGGI